MPLELRGARHGEEKKIKLNAKYLAGQNKNLALFFQREGVDEFISLGEAVPENCVFDLCTLKIKISSSMKYASVPEENSQLVIFPVVPRVEVVELLDKNM